MDALWAGSPLSRGRTETDTLPCVDAERASRSCHFICASLTALNELTDVDLSSRQAVFAAIGGGGGGKPAGDVAGSCGVEEPSRRRVRRVGRSRQPALRRDRGDQSRQNRPRAATG